MPCCDGSTVIRVGGKNAPLVNDTKVVEFRRLNEAANRNAERAEVAVRTPETIYRQCVARDADPAGRLPQPAGDARRRRLGVDRGAAGRDTEGAADAATTSCGSTARCCCFRRSRTASSPRRNRSTSTPRSRRTAEDMDEIYAGRGMRLAHCAKQGHRLVARMNPSLAASLVTNLLKNAYVHGDSGRRR